MEPNTHSTGSPDGLTGQPDGLAALAAVVDQLAAEDRTGQSGTTRAERVLALRQLLDRLEGHWLAELAAVAAGGAAGTETEAGVPAASTAAWLGARLHMSANVAHQAVRTARALFGGPLPQTGQALAAGELSAATPRCWPPAPTTSPTRSPPTPNRSCSRRPGAWTHPDGAGWLAISSWSPTRGADRRTDRHHHHQRGLWWAATWEGMVAVNGLLEAEAGQTLLAALEPWPPRPTPPTPEALASVGPTPWPNWPPGP